jgi:predicted amidophosphoribosyltransferase
MTTIDDLETCPECRAPVDLYARDCPECGADLFEAKAEKLRQLRDAGGMTAEAYEIALEILSEGPGRRRPAAASASK